MKCPHGDGWIGRPGPDYLKHRFSAHTSFENMLEMIVDAWVNQKLERKPLEVESRET